MVKSDPPSDNRLDFSAPRALTAYGLALGAAAAMSWTWAHIAIPPPYLAGLLWGWGIALINALLGLCIKWVSLGGGLTRLLVWGLAVNGVRAAFLLMIIVAVARFDVAPFRPFILAVLCGYLCGMWAEVITLHAASTRNTERR